MYLFTAETFLAVIVNTFPPASVSLIRRRSGSLCHTPDGLAYREKAHGAQNVPGGLFSGVFITADAQRPGVVPDLHDVPHPALRLPRRASIVVQIGNVKAWLVALRILPDQARLVGELSQEEVLSTASAPKSVQEDRSIPRIALETERPAWRQTCLFLPSG